MELTTNALKRVIKQEPALSNYGMNFSKEKRCPVNFKSFKICCKWLSKFKQIKSPQFNSYFLKHVVERLEGTYISNGALIAAAIHLKIPMRFYADWPNTLIAISRRCPYIMIDEQEYKKKGSANDTKKTTGRQTENWWKLQSLIKIAKSAIK